MKTQTSADTGTFSFCANCPTSKNCCGRVEPNGRIDPPLLFGGDIDAVVRFTGETAEAFSSSCGGRSRRLMRTSKNRCHFYRQGKCVIYAVRPADCRLFPFTIMEGPDGRLTWMVFTSLCAVAFDPYSHLDSAKAVLPLLGNDVREYARVETPAMDDEPYIELGDVELPVFADR